MEVVSDIRKENMFTFPVLTYSLLYKEEHFIDENNTFKISRVN